MTTRVLDPAAAAVSFREEIRAQLAAVGERLVLVGVLASEHGPSYTYAQYVARACAEFDIEFRLRTVPRLAAETAIREANADAGVHGIMVYYPIFGTEQDAYLRDLVAPAKDIEGLHSMWSRYLYEGRRFLDAAGTMKAILPCTPLAILKLIEAAGYFASSGPPLAGRTACIFNRSEVVGRPLAAMMANDGARVFSFDVDGALLFQPGAQPGGRHAVSETAVDRAGALAAAEIVITGVPSKSFSLVRGEELRPGCLCVNFSTHKNFDDDVLGEAGVFVKRVGPMTVLMAIRNAVRLRGHARRG